MKNKAPYILTLIFLGSLLLRMYFAFKTNTFTSEAYFHIRNVEHLLKTGFPIFSDELVNGRFIFPSLFYYLLALFAMFSKTLAYKILPEVLMLSLVPLTYLIVRRLTFDETSSLIGALIAGFIPSTIHLINEVSIYSLIIPMVLFMFYLVLHLNDFFMLFLVMGFLFSLISPFSMIVPLALIFYLIIGYAERIKFKPLKTKAVIYVTLLMSFVNFIIYSSLLYPLGFRIFWQNVPKGVLSNYFVNLGIINTVYLIGIVPFLFGIGGIALFFLKNKKNSTYMILGLIGIVALLFSFKLIPVKIGLILFSTILTIPASVAIKWCMDYLNLTKLSRFRNIFIFSFILFTLISLIAPTFTIAERDARKTVLTSELSALEWIKDKTSNDDLVLASPEDAYLITSFADRKVLLDGYYLTQENVEEIYNDIEEIYTSSSYVKFTQKLSKYNVDYIYFSDRTRRFYDVVFLENADNNPECFIPIYSNDRIIVYKLNCKN